MVLNTSFNVKPGEPIVESPRDALAAFLAAHVPGKTIDRLAFVAHGPGPASGVPKDFSLDEAGSQRSSAAATAVLLARRACPLDVEHLVQLSVQRSSGGPWGLGAAGRLAPKRPVFAPAFASEVVRGADGDAARVRVRVLQAAGSADNGLHDDCGGTPDNDDQHGSPSDSREDEWVYLLDELELAILEACGAGSDVDSIVAEFVTADAGQDCGAKARSAHASRAEARGQEEALGGVSVTEVLLRLRRLWQATLIEL